MIYRNLDYFDQREFIALPTYRINWYLNSFYIRRYFVFVILKYYFFIWILLSYNFIFLFIQAHISFTLCSHWWLDKYYFVYWRFLNCLSWRFLNCSIYYFESFEIDSKWNLVDNSFCTSTKIVKYTMIWSIVKNKDTKTTWPHHRNKLLCFWGLMRVYSGLETSF